jgi:ferredoxin-type protein NapG
MPDDKPIDRRRFFRRGLAELFKPLGEAIAPLEKAAKQIGAMEEQLARQQQAAKPKLAKPSMPLPVWLRPPGALDESGFTSTCSRSGECVNVCPAKCIKIDATGAKGKGAPFIEVNEMPCVVCDGLYCMHACPSGALVPTPLADIDMGTAVWREHLCVRDKGEECTLCVDRCPLGTAAIELIDGRVTVNPHGCIGCGVCEHECPTTPKSIVVYPKAMRAT